MASPAEYAVAPADVLDAAKRIAGHVHTTPLMSCGALSTLASAACGVPLALLLKCELLQKTGSFKARGATNAVLSLAPEAAAKGVCTHSSGNHAAALAMAAAARAAATGTPCPATIVMPSNAPEAKKAATAGYGARIVECAPTQAAREAAAREVSEGSGATFIHPSEDPRVIAGQGTLALEVFAQAAQPVDVLVVPCGGGGMISGCAMAARAASPSTVVIGAEPLGADDAARSKASGQLQGFPPGTAPSTMADGLKTTLGPNTWPIVRDCVPAIVTVGEDEIAAALRLVYSRAKLAIEPSAAVGVAAVLSGARFKAALEAHAGEALKAAAGEGRPLRVAVVLCGGNADPKELANILAA